MKQKQLIKKQASNLGLKEFSPINHIDSFVNYTKFHISRVVLIGIEMKRVFHHHFENLEDEVVRNFLLLHDYSKIKMIDGNYENARLLFENIFGKDVKSLSEIDREKASTIIDRINRDDRKIAIDFFEKHHLSNAQIKQLLQLENLADLIDRGMSPFSQFEFGRKLKPASMILKCEIEKSIAHYFEKSATYTSLVGRLHFSFTKH